MAKKILLADDSLTIQKVVELTFSDGEFELVCVSNGQKALDRVREQRPDLILADVVMPEKNGYEVCEAIKSNPATARIPVVLLSGTFEPFDRERAERIGSDAVVSKPFDSQQLLVQVEDLLGRANRQRPAAARPMSQAASSTPAPAPEPEPFETGFASEDFTGSIRVPPVREAGDPFEEEYGKGDVDSAVAAFEREHPEFVTGSEPETAQTDVAEKHLSRGAADPSRGPLGQWLREAPEKPAPPPESGAGADVWQAKGSEPTGPIPHAYEKAMRHSEEPAVPADQAPTQEIPWQSAAARRAESEWKEPRAERETSSAKTRTSLEREKRAAPEPAKVSHAAPTAEVPREIEIMAQTASIPELKKMLSSVVKPGEELSEDQMEKLAIRVVEKLSERIVREIAWEIIPDMAEIVIKQRIKELETGIE